MVGDTPAYDICPDPLYGFVNLVGKFFSWGLAGGSVVHYIKARRGGECLAGAVSAVRKNAPRVAGKFGARTVRSMLRPLVRRRCRCVVRERER
ncbi:unnamed protein product [Urochloa humidicola]